MRAPGERVWRDPPWVRIPPSPPLPCKRDEFLQGVFDKSPVFRYHLFGRARRGASGALNPQSALAGSNSPIEGWRIRDYRCKAALKAGSCAAGAVEPGQIREEAAIRRSSRVPQECLAGVGWQRQVGWRGSIWGARLALFVGRDCSRFRVCRASSLLFS